MDDFFDDLRDLDNDDDSTSSEPDFEGAFDGDEMPVAVGQVIGEETFSGSRSASDGPFLGMSAGERAFLSMMLFFNVLVLGIGLLLATKRIAI